MKKGMQRLTRGVAVAVLGLLAAVSAPAADSDRAAPAPRGKLVFLLTTGLEDVQTMTASLRHAKIAKESGHLEDVVWLAYGRGVQALAGKMAARPAPVAAFAKEAQAAGVRLIVCRTALDHMGIPPETLDPRPEIVPMGVVKLAELVAQGYEVVRY